LFIGAQRGIAGTRITYLDVVTDAVERHALVLNPVAIERLL